MKIGIGAEATPVSSSSSDSIIVGINGGGELVLTGTIAKGEGVVLKLELNKEVKEVVLNAKEVEEEKFSPSKKKRKVEANNVNGVEFSGGEEKTIVSQDMVFLIAEAVDVLL